MDYMKKLNEAGLRAVYAGSTHGGEYHSPCPFCLDRIGDGGKDRFCVWPSQARAWCRRCGWHGSIAVVYAELRGVTESAARCDLGLTLQPRIDVSPPNPHRLLSADKWQDQAAKLVRTRAMALFGEDCGRQLRYLRGRGLSEETIRAARLGGSFEKRYYERDSFGLAPEEGTDSTRAQKVFAPVGIVIPYFDAAGKISRVQFRCEMPDRGPYRVLPGSRRASMTLLPKGEIRAVVLVEAALDALLCHQEVPEDFAFIALGSTSYEPDDAAVALMANAEFVLVATDSDQAGAHAFRRLLLEYGGLHRLIVPPEFGKDIGEAFLSGVSIAEWCEIGLKSAERGDTSSTMPPRIYEPKAVSPPPAPEVEVSDAGLDVKYKLITSAKKARAAIESLLQAEYVMVDVETAPLEEHAEDPKAALDPWRARPRLVQATTGGTVYLFDLNRVPLAELAPLFSEGWVAHNAIFDYKHLLFAQFKPWPVVPRCTMLCDNALTNQSRSLSDLYEAHFRIALDKELQDSDWSADELSAAQLQYAARDVVAVHRLWERLRQRVSDRDRDRLCHLLHDAQQAVALMELAGIAFEAEAHAGEMKTWRRERKRALAELKEMAGEDFNANSHPQLAAFLESQLSKKQLREWPRTGGGQLSTAAKDIAEFREVPAVKAFLEYRRWSDLVGKFGTTLAAHINPVTGRIHPHFRLGGARTGRMSANAPNVQGLPRDAEFRRFFVPAPGQVFVRADFNQMQLRIAALLSGDPKLLHAYEKGRDVHRLTAASVLGKEVADITSEERSLAKAIGFGILFGMGARGLRAYALSNYSVTITDSKAAQVRDRFFEAYPEVRRWQLDQVADAERTGCSTTPSGRVRNFTRENKQDYHTAAMNTPIQGGEGEVMLATLARLPQALQPLGGALVNCVHDELLVECPPESVEEVSVAMRECMEQGMRQIFPKATLEKLVEIGHGPSWAETK